MIQCIIFLRLIFLLSSYHSNSSLACTRSLSLLNSSRTKACPGVCRCNCSLSIKKGPVSCPELSGFKRKCGLLWQHFSAAGEWKCHPPEHREGSYFQKWCQAGCCAFQDSQGCGRRVLTAHSLRFESRQGDLYLGAEYFEHIRFCHGLRSMFNLLRKIKAQKRNCHLNPIPMGGQASSFHSIQ